MPSIQILIILQLCRERLACSGFWPAEQKQCSIRILISEQFRFKTFKYIRIRLDIENIRTGVLLYLCVHVASFQFDRDCRLFCFFKVLSVLQQIIKTIYVHRNEIQYGHFGFFCKLCSFNHCIYRYVDVVVNIYKNQLLLPLPSLLLSLRR